MHGLSLSIEHSVWASEKEREQRVCVWECMCSVCVWERERAEQEMGVCVCVCVCCGMCAWESREALCVRMCACVQWAYDSVCALCVCVCVCVNKVCLGGREVSTHYHTHTSPTHYHTHTHNHQKPIYTRTHTHTHEHTSQWTECVVWLCDRVIVCVTKQQQRWCARRWTSSRRSWPTCTPIWPPNKTQSSTDLKSKINVIGLNWILNSLGAFNSDLGAWICATINILDQTQQNDVKIPLKIQK